MLSGVIVKLVFLDFAGILLYHSITFLAHPRRKVGEAVYRVYKKHSHTGGMCGKELTTASQFFCFFHQQSNPHPISA